MNQQIALISLALGLFLCLPLFRRIYIAITESSESYLKEQRMEYIKDPFSDSPLGPRGKDDKFVMGFVVALIFPGIASMMVAFPIYFVLVWLITLF